MSGEGSKSEERRGGKRPVLRGDRIEWAAGQKRSVGGGRNLGYELFLWYWVDYFVADPSEIWIYMYILKLEKHLDNRYVKIMIFKNYIPIYYNIGIE